VKAFASILVAAAIISASGPQPFLAWFAESALILIAGAVLIATFPRYPLTGITYILFLAFALVVLEGAHFTYAREPIGDWARQTFGLHRNHFDRFGHLMQGVAPALLFRELLITRVSFPRGKALFWTVCGVTLGMAAMFELLEWQYAASRGGPAIEDLGAQGDPWDTQWDMFMALAGALISQKLFAARQDWQLGHERAVELGHGVHAEQLQRADDVTS
jgi:putative membrane protein